MLTPDQQAKLLRVIETGEYEAVGSNDTQDLRAALIVGSNVNLEELVAAGKFRKDFFYRLNTLSFVMPPLRERVLDIQYLVRKFALDQSRAYRTKLWHIEPEFLDLMQQYCWPGNIREMENVMRRAMPLLPRRRADAQRVAQPRPRKGGRLAGLRLKPRSRVGLLGAAVREAEYRIITESLRRNNFRRVRHGRGTGDQPGHALQQDAENGHSGCAEKRLRAATGTRGPGVIEGPAVQSLQPPTVDVRAPNGRRVVLAAGDFGRVDSAHQPRRLGRGRWFSAPTWFATGVNRLNHTDLWGHLSFGRWIVEHHALAPERSLSFLRRSRVVSQRPLVEPSPRLPLVSRLGSGGNGAGARACC